ncbi:hypothetical protein BSKO_11333 [Bryopsis sp. KO-2023]|nr:hypothetical protein BSKO_11333 [Bryopsis sp. KO-2023]
MELRQLGTQIALPISASSVVLGRRRELGIASKKVSRNHCSVESSVGEDFRPCAAVTASKKIWIKTNSGDDGGSEAYRVVLPNETTMIRLGDAVYLSLEEISHGFQLHMQASEISSAPPPHPSKSANTPSQVPTTDVKPGIFTGCTFVFWAKSHTRTLMKKVIEGGGKINEKIDSSTTHIVVSTDYDGHHVKERLAKEGLELGGLPRMPTFVTVAFVSDSVARGEKAQEKLYGIYGGLDYTKSEMATDVPNEETGALELMESDTGDEGQGLHDLDPDAKPSADERALEGPQLPKRSVDGGPSEAETRSGKRSRHEEASTEWGLCGNWIEPYEEASAKETLDKLLIHWQHMKRFKATEILKTSQAHILDSQAAADSEGSEGVGWGEDGQQGEEGGTCGESMSVNTVCGHVACSRLTICILEHLDVVKKLYQGKKDQFRIKAIDRAVRLLENVDIPLQCPQDAEALGLGAKTTAKVVEIMNTGKLRRNDAMVVDERRRVISLFMEVWGAAEATAEVWYKSGCRTLADVEQRDDLSQTQKVGLKYFEDFKVKIPRKEVEQLGAQLGEVGLDVTADLMGVSPESIKDTICVRTMGSYCRGKPETGDVDILISPPPCDTPPHCCVILQDIQKRLLEMGILTHDLKRKLRYEEPVSWMGVCNSPSTNRFRRIDIKVYPRRWLPFAINYFTGSEYFCRALRYWSNTPTRETRKLAQKVCPSATAFKLSDQGMWPVTRRRRRNSTDDGLTPMAPALECKCETDIFTYLGLAYVPPHMRFFHNFH